MTSEFGEGAVCMPNIGPRERAKRERIGIIMGVATVGIAGALFAVHAPHVARLGLFLPALISAYGFAQAREKT